MNPIALTPTTSALRTPAFAELIDRYEMNLRRVPSRAKAREQNQVPQPSERDEKPSNTGTVAEVTLIPGGAPGSRAPEFPGVRQRGELGSAQPRDSSLIVRRVPVEAEAVIEEIERLRESGASWESILPEEDGERVRIVARRGR